jgi:hypothetical protein
MIKRSTTCIAIFFCIAMISVGCKKGCGTCKTYGSVNTGYLQPYATQVCVNNFCTCLNGLEGDSCQTYSINKYFQPSSTWLVTDGCSGNPSYSVFVSTSSYYPYTTFYINGLFGLSQVAVDINSTQNNQGNGLSIQPQTVGAATFSGTGTYTLNGSAGKMTFNMDYNNNGIDVPCILYLYQQ